MTQDDRISVSAIIQQLPQRLQNRLYSLGSFVQGLIEEEISQSGRYIHLDQEDVQLIQLAALIYSLDSFFRVGSAAARAASITFEEFGLDGFQIGSTTFTRDNENTRRGEELATQMRRSISGTPLSRAIVTSPYMRQLITTLIRELSDGQEEIMDR